MPYVKRTVHAGKTIEIDKYYTSRYHKKGIRRGDKVKKTSEVQERINKQEAERKLRILLNANYGFGDMHLVLNYVRRKGEPQRTRDEMRADADIFLRQMRKKYKQAGKVFKYVHVMEIGQKGARHHHLVINGGISNSEIQECWNKAYKQGSRIHIHPLDDSGNYADLAAYLIKYTDMHRGNKDGALMGKRWNNSKNLIRPEPVYKIISNRDCFRSEAVAPKGFYIDRKSVRKGVHGPEFFGYGFFSYRLVKLE